MTTGLIVDAPTVVPAGYGLLSVAQPVAGGDPHWPTGVQFEEHGAAKAFAADGWCRPSLAVVIDQAAGTGQVQTLTLTGPPTGGSYTLSAQGTSVDVAFGAAAAAIQTAVRSLPGFGDAVVAGAGPFTITLTAADGNPPALAVDDSALVGGTAAVAVTTEGTAAGLTTIDQGVPYGESAAVTVFAVFDCSPVGRDLDAAAQLARLKLSYGAPRALEHAVWTGKDSAAAVITGKSLAGAAELDGGTAEDLVLALGALEEWIGDNYAGQGVIHASRRVAATFARYRLAQPVSGHLETSLGNRVAFGQGYDGSGPDGTAAAAGTSWLYATPAVSYRQGEVTTAPDPSHALNRLGNGLIIAAEQQYLVAWESSAAAMLANLG